MECAHSQPGTWIYVGIVALALAFYDRDNPRDHSRVRVHFEADGRGNLFYMDIKQHQSKCFPGYSSAFGLECVWRIVSVLDHKPGALGELWRRDSNCCSYRYCLRS